MTGKRMAAWLLAAAMCCPAWSAAQRRKVRRQHTPDSMLLVVPSLEMPTSRGKMNTSAFPVKISVTGRVVQIQSDHSQLLPIYNQNGVLYLTTRLNRGTNWLGGLPRGRYFINNRPITIN